MKPNLSLESISLSSHAFSIRQYYLPESYQHVTNQIHISIKYVLILFRSVHQFWRKIEGRGGVLESEKASAQKSSNYCSGYRSERENSEENGDLGF